MAIPRKGSRKIVVDGIAYRWRIRAKPTYWQAIGHEDLLAAVELWDKPGSTLSISFPWLRPDSWFSESKTPVTPKQIEEAIKEALACGWKPDERGNTHFLRIKETTAVPQS